MRLSSYICLQQKPTAMKYKVAVKENHTADPDQLKDGYLAFCGVVQVYDRGEAQKKARMFGGVIEPVKLSASMGKLNITTIPANALLDGVVRLLKGRESFTDNTDNNETFYQGDVFEAILGEIAENPKSSVSKKVIEQLEELAGLVDGDYLLVTNS